MGTIIEDGAGTGIKAAVTSEKRLKTDTISQSPEHHANIEEGEAYHIVFQQTPAAANNCFLYIKNTHTLNIIIEGIWLRTNGNERITIKFNSTGTPSGTTAIPSNCKTDSGNEAIGTFITGNAITGLSGGTIIDRLYVESSEKSENYNFETDLIIGPNGVFTAYAEVGSIEIDGTLVMYYHE